MSKNNKLMLISGACFGFGLMFALQSPIMAAPFALIAWLCYILVKG